MTLNTPLVLSRETVTHLASIYTGGRGVPPRLSKAVDAMRALVEHSDRFTPGGWEADSEAHVAAGGLMQVLEDTDDEGAEVSEETFAAITAPLAALYRSRS